jgi:hypothetical protein
MNRQHLIESALFALGWLWKGTMTALIGQYLFKPLAFRLVRYARTSESSFALWINHHLAQHPEWKLTRCEICRMPEL